VRLGIRQFDGLVGYVESTPDRGVVFGYAPEYLTSADARALSQSLPLRESPFPQAAALPFFSGLLPDGDVRRRIADYLHVSESSTLRLLDALGGECAGTISLFREEDEEDRGTTGMKVTGSRTDTRIPVMKGFPSMRSRG
jgi:serine/threonine-protein kinase HipA